MICCNNIFKLFLEDGIRKTKYADVRIRKVGELLECPEINWEALTKMNIPNSYAKYYRSRYGSTRIIASNSKL